MGIPNLSYQDFSLRLHRKGSIRPIVGQFELTHRCNLRCQHCYIVRDTRRKELSSKQFCRILEQVYDEGCLWLCLTGGEPLLREDFLDIYSYAYKKGFIITVFTSATLLDKETAAYMRRFPPFCVEVTLNGVTKKTYELVTQTQGSFEKAMRGIDLIRRYGLPLRLKCQAMTLNIDELPLMRRFYKKIGQRFSCSTLIDPRMDGSLEPCALRLPLRKVLELRRFGEAHRGRDEIEDRFFAGEDMPPQNRLFRCPGGTWAFYVSPYAELFFCNSLRRPCWDLRRDTFKNGFYRFFSKIRSRRFKTESPCRSCRHWRLCMWCPGKAQLECADQEAPIEYYCELAKYTAPQRPKTAGREDILESKSGPV